MNTRGVDQYWQGATTGPSRHRGLTLIEVMITVLIVGIIASIALPSYQQYIQSSRARSAAADLMALATAFENRFQRQLSYAAAGTTTANTAATANLVVGWQPSAGDFFTYTANVTASTYDLSASGSGDMSGCTITLDEENARSASDACGITSSW